MELRNWFPFDDHIPARNLKKCSRVYVTNIELNGSKECLAVSGNGLVKLFDVENLRCFRTIGTGQPTIEQLSFCDGCPQLLIVVTVSGIISAIDCRMPFAPSAMSSEVSSSSSASSVAGADAIGHSHSGGFEGTWDKSAFGGSGSGGKSATVFKVRTASRGQALYSGTATWRHHAICGGTKDEILLWDMRKIDQLSAVLKPTSDQLTEETKTTDSSSLRPSLNTPDCRISDMHNDRVLRLKMVSGSSTLLSASEDGLINQFDLSKLRTVSSVRADDSSSALGDDEELDSDYRPAASSGPFVAMSSFGSSQSFDGSLPCVSEDILVNTYPTEFGHSLFDIGTFDVTETRTKYVYGLTQNDSVTIHALTDPSEMSAMTGQSSDTDVFRMSDSDIVGDSSHGKVPTVGGSTDAPHTFEYTREALGKQNIVNCFYNEHCNELRLLSCNMHGKLRLSVLEPSKVRILSEWLYRDPLGFGGSVGTEAWRRDGHLGKVRSAVEIEKSGTSFLISGAEDNRVCVWSFDAANARGAIPNSELIQADKQLSSFLADDCDDL